MLHLSGSPIGLSVNERLDRIYHLYYIRAGALKYSKIRSDFSSRAGNVVFSVKPRLNIL